jgi:phosphoglycolate phosphatase
MHLLFDIDGTVVDHTKRIYGLYRDYCQAHGLTVLDELEYLERKSRGEDDRTIVRETFPREVVDHYLAWKFERIEGLDALQHDVLVAGMKEALEELATSHRLAAVSARQSNDVLVEQLTDLGIWLFFQASLSVGLGPPVEAKASAIDDYLTEKRIGPADATLIGDTEVEIAAADRARIRCISVGWGLRSGSFLLAHKATRVVESPEELSELLRAR